MIILLLIRRSVGFTLGILLVWKLTELLRTTPKKKIQVILWDPKTHQVIHDINLMYQWNVLKCDIDSVSSPPIWSFSNFSPRKKLLLGAKTFLKWCVTKHVRIGLGEWGVLPQLGRSSSYKWIDFTSVTGISIHPLKKLLLWNLYISSYS